MRKTILLAALLCAAGVIPATADEEPSCSDKDWFENQAYCEQKEARDHRWKVSLGYLPVGPGWLQRPDVDAGFRDHGTIRSWATDYYREYLRNNAVGLDDPYRLLDNPHAGGGTLCCTADYAMFRAMGFSGRVGDTYQLWARRRLDRYEEVKNGLGASLEYRAAGALWASFSFQMSGQSVAEVTETGEFLRVVNVNSFRAQDRFNFSHPVPYWEVEATRHRTERWREYKQRSYQFSLLAKYDLTRENRHWSVMPQAGADLLLVRMREYNELKLYDWRIFSGELHPSEWAHSPREVESWTFDEVTWRERVRPVAGLTVELWPGRKLNGLGIVVDGRYHFGTHGEWLTYDGPPVLNPFYLDVSEQRITFSVNAIVRF